MDRFLYRPQCECERGFMFKTALKDREGNPVLFILERGTHKEFIHYTLMIFQGYCSGCGQVFRWAYSIEDFLDYPDVD